MGFAVGHRRGVLCAASGCAVGLAVLAAATGTRAAAPPATVSVTLSDFGIRLSVGAVRERKVTFRVVNRGNVAHDFAIAGMRTRPLAHGARATLTVTVARPGGYRFSSTRVGDAALGMTGIFRLGTRVTGTAPIVTRSRLKLTPVSTGLGALTDVDSSPGDAHRLMVVRQDGLVLLFEDDVRQARPFLDLRSVVRNEGEDGLLSLAFAPDYATSGLFYVYYLTVPQPTSFGTDGSGRVYVTTATGGLYRLGLAPAA